MSRETAASAADDASDRQRRGTWLLLLARGAFFASAYVVTAILTRKLGPASYGIYGVIISQVLWLEMVVTAGIPAATSKLMADGQHEPREVERSARTLLIGFSVVLFALCWFLAPSVARLMKIPGGATLFRYALFDLPFAATYASYEGLLYGHRRFGVLARAQVVYAGARVCAVLAMMLVGISVERALLAIVLSSVAVCAVLLMWLPPNGFGATRRTVKDISRFAGPMALCLICGQVLVNLDLWSLQSLWSGSGDVVGHYVASLNLARTLAVIPAVQAGVLFSSVAWASASGNKALAVSHIGAAIRFALIIAAAACVILGMNGGAVLAFLFSPPYAAGQQFIALQLIGFALFALLDVFANALMAAGRQRVVAVVLTAAVPFVWLLNYQFIPRVGPVGAALALVLGVGAAAAVTGALVRAHFGPFVPVGTVTRVLIASAVVAVASALVDVQGRAVLAKAVALGVLYLAALYLLGEVSPRDVALGRQAASRGHRA